MVIALTDGMRTIWSEIQLVTTKLKIEIKLIQDLFLTLKSLFELVSCYQGRN